MTSLHRGTNFVQSPIERDGGEAQKAIQAPSFPFLPQQAQTEPKKPGRKKGENYGERASRPIPDHIDRELDAPVQTGVEDVNGAPACPECHETLEKLEIHIQYQTDIPEIPAPEVTQFNVETAEYLF